MEFDLHKKLRFVDNNESRDGSHLEWIIYELDSFIDQEFLTASLEYYSHLLKTGFRNEATLLKYFGNSFFHDGEIKSLELNAAINELTISIVRENDLADINRFLSSVGERGVDPTQYFKNPAIYQCRFSNVENYTKPETIRAIIDTELHKTPSGKNRMCISMTPFDEIEFEFSRCTVRIKNMKHIQKYLLGARVKRPPWHDAWRFRQVSLPVLRKRAKLIKKILNRKGSRKSLNAKKISCTGRGEKADHAGEHSVMLLHFFS
jgi:hypothetical protein